MKERLSLVRGVTLLLSTALVACSQASEVSEQRLSTTTQAIIGGSPTDDPK